MNVSRRSSTSLRLTLAKLIAIAVAVLVALPLGMSASAAAADPAADGKLRIILFYKDNFHASHVEARAAVKALVAELGSASEYNLTVQIDETQDPTVFNTANLSTVDALVFAQTGGVLFNAAQRTALESYIRGGGGFAGIHYTAWSVGNSEADENPFYAKLVGASSEGHPEPAGGQSGRVVVTDPASPLTQGLPATETRTDEWYDWVVNPAPNVHTLLSSDESSHPNGTDIGENGTTHPITWCQTIDQGRSWYNAQGHAGSAYSEASIRTELKLGIAYAAGLLAADCSPPKKDVEGAWSPVTPWPLMPINVSLTNDGKVQSFGSVGGWSTDATPYDFSGNSGVTQGGQTEIDIWDPATPRTLANLRDGILPNTTYTDLFCSMQVQNPHNKTVVTVGGDDSLGGNAPNDAAIGVTSYSTNNGLQNEAPMNFPRWYPTGTTMPSGDIVVQGGTLRGGPGGPGATTPEIYTPDDGTGWKALTGATSAQAYAQGGENRWWYPRAFVNPQTGKLFTLTGTQMFDLDPAANGGTGAINLLGQLPAGVSNQGANGNPVGATSTATMYAPGKILQAGGGWWGNGGGPNGARAAFTIDINGATPVVTAIAPMKYQRHWGTSTLLPDGRVIVTGGSRDNAANGGYVTNPEIWDPATGQWTEVKVPNARPRLYHSSALLLPDGRVMTGGGGAPGPTNYTDVEYYSPSYLFDGDQAAPRPAIGTAPKKMAYNANFTFPVSGGAAGNISKVTLLRNGSMTHSFNNDQNFQELQIVSQGAGTVTVKAPADANFAPPGTYMVFAFDSAGTPSVGKMVDIDPVAKVDARTPKIVEQFEYPALQPDWRGGNPTNVFDVAAGGGKMAPWTVDSAVQLVRGTSANQGGLGYTGYQLGLGATGKVTRVLKGLDPGRTYRISLRYARDSRAAGTANATAALKVGDLDTTLTATTANPSAGGPVPTYATYVGTFVAAAAQQALSLEGLGGAVMIDDLVIKGADPGASDIPIHYEFEEGAGTTDANTGTDQSVGAATLTGTAGWNNNGVFGKALDLQGGSNANAVDLPDNLLQNATDFTTSFWVKPDTKGNWINLFHIGDPCPTGCAPGDPQAFFQIQMQTQAAGNTGLAATFKKKGSALQERIYANPTKDVVAGRWNHVVFTRSGTTGTLYLDGVQIAQVPNLTITMADIGPTRDNWLGRNGYPDPAFDGLMDDVRIYPTSALTASDVAAMYAEGAAEKTVTAVTVTPVSPSPFGEPIDISATFKTEAGANAQGSAQLWIDGNSVGAAKPAVNGVVTFDDVALNPGNHTVEVRVTAADGFRDSTGTLQHTVAKPPPGVGIPIHYTFDENTGLSAANVGSNLAVGPATLPTQGSGWWAPGAPGYASGVDLPGGGGGSGNQIKLPDNIADGMDEEFTVSVWARPEQLPQWVPLVQIGSSTDTFFLLQSNTQTAGATGFAATFKQAGNNNQERLVLGANNDLPLNDWTHVVFTMSGGVGKIYFDGQLMGTRTDFTLGIADVGIGGTTTANMIGGTSWPDGRWNGAVDDFRMYGYELTAAQVQELFSTPPNQAPVGVADDYDAVNTSVLSVPAASGVLANDTDADSADTLKATLITDTANGTVTLAADGSFTYEAPVGFTGTERFTYKVNDGKVDSAAVTVTINVTDGVGPNAAPVGVDDTFTTAAGSALTQPAPGVLANDTDADSDALTAEIITQPINGTVTMDPDGSFTYTPDAGFSGKDVFTYKANDGKADSETTKVTVTVTGGGGNPSTNVAPVSSADAYRVDQDAVLTVPAPGVLANDTDTNADTLTAAIVTGPLNGTVTMDADGSFKYTPNAGFFGTERFSYRANDGKVGSAAAAVTIYVTEAQGSSTNVAPVGGDDAFSTVEGSALTLPAPGVLANDTDANGDMVKATDVKQPINGTVKLQSDGSFTYTPDAGFSGVDVFTYRAADAISESAVVTVSITVKRAGAGNGGSGAGGAVTAVAGVAAPYVYGRPGTVSVAVMPADSTGNVELLQGDTVVATGALAAGGAKLTLVGKTLKPGTYDFIVRYVGDGAHKASSSPVQVTVEKVAPKIKVKAPSSVQIKKRAKVKVKLSAPDGVPVTGTVTLKIKGGKTLKGTVKAGKVVFRLPKAKKKGKLKIKVSYLGSDLALSQKMSVIIKVTKRR